MSKGEKRKGCKISWLEVPDAVAYAKVFVGDDFDLYGMVEDYINGEIKRLERVDGKKAARLVSIVYLGDNRMANYVRALCELTGHTTALVLVDPDDDEWSTVFLGYTEEYMRKITRTIRRYMATIRAALKHITDDEADYRDEMLNCLYLSEDDDVDVSKCLEKARFILWAEAIRRGPEQ